MARKKSSNLKTSSPQEFSVSPFKKLKGLSVLAEEKPPALGRADKREPAGCNKPAEPVSDRHTFAEEMDLLGVSPLPGRAIRESIAGQKVAEKPSRSQTSREEIDRAVFLDAVGSVDVVFKDEWPEDEPPKKAALSRMKLVERGRLNPEAELELHGSTVDEAAAKVGFFLQNAHHQNLQTVLIITGRGLHSDAGPVLRQAVETLLNQESEHVLEWGVAPRRFGGDGALVVFLRQEANR